MKNITPDVVKGLWAHMSHYYRSEIVNKDDSELMELAGRALDVMGILDQERFMKTYTTTVGDVIYVPFEIGCPNEDGSYSLISQVRICAHEHEHVAQWRRGGAKFMLEYLTDSEKRTFFEVQAMRCNMEIQWWYNQTLPDISRSVLKLKDYNCTDENIATATQSLKMVSKVIEKSGVTSDAGKIAVRYLNAVAV